MSEEQKLKLLKKGLVIWAEKKGVDPPKFRDETKYSYNHAYQLLRGDQPITYDTIGRFLLAYGLQDLAFWFEQSKIPFDQSVLE